MVGIIHFGFVMLVGLLGMGVIHAFVSALRQYLDPETPRNYYATVAFVVLLAGGALILSAPLPTDGVTLMWNFGGYFAVALAMLYGGLAVVAKESNTEDDRGQDRGGSDRPLSRR